MVQEDHSSRRTPALQYCKETINIAISLELTYYLFHVFNFDFIFYSQWQDPGEGPGVGLGLMPKPSIIQWASKLLKPLALQQNLFGPDYQTKPFFNPEVLIYFEHY